ncbi:putative outer membrane protein PmpI precursor [Gimesia panareensis]|uniref:Putative outer membrane protein PmpI n=1 Tax=Gimesia panareensis TaxID=2527978 RepID=A0A518FY91_9PLAN|nr:choice-of-anchor Q domain-containing protein [Gimesia panareensis]QDV21281.1 putative outer membrane protein PmpI precursor [Gimesia panareensis]
MFPFRWLNSLQDQFQSCLVRDRRRRQLQQHHSHAPRIARAVSLHAAETLEDRMLLTTFTVVNTNDSGEGSLRAAIEAANAQAGADEITFAATLKGQTIELASELQITDDLTIDGLGADPWRLSITIDAGYHSRIFNIDDNALSAIDVTISGLSLINGSADQGGAILSHENLTLSNMAFLENQAAGIGGAISSYRNQLTISNSLFDQNTAGSSGGGIYSLGSWITILSTSFLGNTSDRNGGGIYAAQDAVPARIEDCLFEDNTAVSGGGIYNTTMVYQFGSSELSIARTRFQNNTATDSGGGIFNGDSSISITDSSLTENTAARGGAINGRYNGSISLNSSTLSGNIATDYGGGIAYRGSLEIANSTLSGNQAHGSGGAIYQFGTNAYSLSEVIESVDLPISLLCDDGIPLQSSLTLSDSDLAATSSIAAVDNGISLCTLPLVIISNSLKISNSTITLNSAGVSGGGLAGFFGNDTQINNSIIAGNSASSSSQIQGIFDDGFNIIQDSIEGLLDPVLRDNGGPTLTHALLAGSTAIDAGDNQRVTESGLETDQRGGDYQRIYAGTVDIGAVEFHGLNLVVDTLSDADDGDYSSGHLSLREAIKLANQTIDTDQITFSNSLAGGTIMLESELLISSGMYIIGLGQEQLTLDGGNDSRIFRIDDGDTYSAAGVEISGLSLKHGNADRGGAILNYEDLLLSDVALSENEAAGDGGAIYHAGGQLTVTDSLFSGNVAWNNGGGIYNSHQDLNVQETTFYRNVSGAGGGGIYSIYGSKLKHSRPDTIPGPAFPVFRSVYTPIHFINDGDTENNVVAILHSSFLENEANSGGGVYMTQDDYSNWLWYCDVVTGLGGTAAVASQQNSDNLSLTGNTIVGCTFTGNTADKGGGLYNDGQLTLGESTFTENRADYGGGIYHGTGSLTIQNSTVSGNSATRSGGGIYSSPDYPISRTVYIELGFIQSEPLNFTPTVNELVFSGNGVEVTADLSAEQVALDSASSSFDTSSTNPFSAADTAISSDADLMYQVRSSSLHIQNSTITGNSAGVNGGGLYLTNADNSFIRSSNDITNSIIAGNTSPDNAQVKGEYDGDFNIVQDSIDGLLDPVLRDNGGPTKTHALLQGSAAINAGSNAAVEAAGLTTDQRGGTHQRIFDGTVDIGAVEFDAFSLVVDTLSDEDDGDYSAGRLSLREAIRLANQRIGADTITFAGTLAGQTIYLNGELLISDSLTIEADITDQIIIDAGHNGRVFTVDDGTDALIDVSLQGLTLTYGEAERGGAILNYENLVISDSEFVGNEASEHGGGIYHAGGLLTVANSRFFGNLAGQNGGGIYNDTHDMQIDGCEFVENRAQYHGGGVYNSQGIARIVFEPILLPAWGLIPTPDPDGPSDSENGSEFAPAPTLEYIEVAPFSISSVPNVTSISNSSFINNSAVAGGGLYSHYSSPYIDLMSSTFSASTTSGPEITDNIVDHCTFTENRAVDGAGIFQDGGALKITDSLINLNTATQAGGGIKNLGRLQVLNSTFSGNQATEGGALDNSFIARLLLEQCTLTENMATTYGGGINSRNGSMVLVNSTLSHNHAGRAGGGIRSSIFYFSRIIDSSQFVDSSSTGTEIANSGNAAAPVSYVHSSSLVQLVKQLTIINCTITGNTADLSGGGISDDGVVGAYSVFDITNSIIAGNSATESAQVEGEYDGDFNIIQDSIDGLLDSVLRDNGGPTWTHALLPGSAAINVGSNAAVEQAGLTTDQRGAGYERIKEGTVDIGAYEVQAPYTQIEMRFVNSRTRTSSGGEKSELPENRTWIDEWGNHWLEIWISTPGSTDAGIQSAGFNLNYNPQVAQAVSIEFGPAFTGAQSGAIDNSTGTVTGLSAETAQTDVGDDQYVLFARVLFESATGNETDANPGEQIVYPEFTLNHSHVRLVGGAISEVIQGAPLDSILYKNLYGPRTTRSVDSLQYDLPTSSLFNTDWWNELPFVDQGSADDSSQLSLIVLPYSQTLTTADLLLPLADERLLSDNLTQGENSQRTPESDTTELADWDTLIDGYFSELNDTSDLLSF